MMIRDVPALLEGLSARDVTVWGEAPRKRPHTNPSGLKTVVLGGTILRRPFRPWGMLCTEFNGLAPVGRKSAKAVISRAFCSEMRTL